MHVIVESLATAIPIRNNTCLFLQKYMRRCILALVEGKCSLFQTILKQY